MNTSKYTRRTSDFHMGTPGMRWDPDYSEWVWPERLPAFSSWFDPQPYLDTHYQLGVSTRDASPSYELNLPRAQYESGKHYV